MAAFDPRLRVARLLYKVLAGLICRILSGIPLILGEQWASLEQTSCFLCAKH